MATIDPPPARAMAAPACLKVRNVPVRLVPRMPSHSSSEVVMSGPRPPRPAAATQRSQPGRAVGDGGGDRGGPTCSSSATSHGADGDDLGAAGARASSSATAPASRSGLRPAMVTDAPSATSRRAHSRPMPEPPPVTRADCPASGGSAARHGRRRYPRGQAMVTRRSRPGTERGRGPPPTRPPGFTTVRGEPIPPTAPAGARRRRGAPYMPTDRTPTDRRPGRPG